MWVFSQLWRDDNGIDRERRIAYSVCILKTIGDGRDRGYDWEGERRDWMHTPVCSNVFLFSISRVCGIDLPL